MNSDLKNFIFGSFCLIVILLLFNLGLKMQSKHIVYHEENHKAINSIYGINSEITYHHEKVWGIPFLDGGGAIVSGMNIAEQPCPDTACKLAHEYNEISSDYNLLVLWTVIYSAIFIMVAVGVGGVLKL